MKNCTACRTEKPTTEFHKNRAKPDGLATECKGCAIARVAAHREKNRDEVLAKKRSYHMAHREQINAAKRAERPAILARERAYRETHPEVGWKSHYLERSRKHGFEPVVEDFTRKDVIDEYGDACAHCAGSFDELDHFPVPVAHGGHHTLANVRPSCMNCNRKAARFAGYGDPLDTAAGLEGAAR